MNNDDKSFVAVAVSVLVTVLLIIAMWHIYSYRTDRLYIKNGFSPVVERSLITGLVTQHWSKNAPADSL